jgi:hypothetical protein
MKKCICLLMLSLFLLATVQAKTIIVSNIVNSGAQYSNLQTAINEATAGDTIMVAASPINYGIISINKKLCLLGQGYKPEKEFPYPTQLIKADIVAGADGSEIQGFCFLSVNYVTVFSVGANNVIVKRNQFNWTSIANNNVDISNSNSVLLAENIFLGETKLTNSHNVSFNNNILIKPISVSANSAFISFTNNNILAAGNSINNANFSNNIFYYLDLNNPLQENPGSPAVSGSSCVFNNNVYFKLTYPNPLQIGVNGNSGTGNVFDDPKFVLINITDFPFSCNFQLQPGSPAINAGSDGRDIGAYGGANPIQYPLNGEPRLPQIKSLVLGNNVVPSNGTLEVRIKGKAGN